MVKTLRSQCQGHLFHHLAGEDPACLMLKKKKRKRKRNPIPPTVAGPQNDSRAFAPPTWSTVTKNPGMSL